MSARWTQADLSKALERNPSLSADAQTPHETPNSSPVPDPKPKRHEAPALGRADEGEKEGVPRITVRFVGYRVRPLDPDNFAGSVKDLLDGLRHAGLIPGDEPWRIRLETEQERVRSFAQEKTLIEISTSDLTGISERA